MKYRKITAVIVLAAFSFGLSACASAPLVEKMQDKYGRQKTAAQVQMEKDEEARGFLIKSIASFSGLVIGGLIGLLTSPKQSAVTTAIGGGLAGGAIGFGLGMVIFDNTKPGDKNTDDKKVNEYFQDYRNIQLKE
jgi:hypothetical protein